MMQREPDTSPRSKAAAKDTESVTALLFSMADTTWRMVLPAVIFVAGGLYLDIHLGTKPWLTLVGLVLGLVGGSMLIRRQLKRSEK